MEEIYSKDMVKRTIEEIDRVRAIQWKLRPDSSLLLAIYDVERAIKFVPKVRVDRWGTFDEITFIQLWMDGFSVNEIANVMGESELKIYREKDNVAQKLANFLNGGDK